MTISTVVLDGFGDVPSYLLTDGLGDYSTPSVVTSRGLVEVTVEALTSLSVTVG